MTNVEYLISIHPSKFHGYQSKKDQNGYVKAFITPIWNATKEWSELDDTNHYGLFIDMLIYIIIHERYCLERAFQKIRIKGGMCNPCCITNLTDNTMAYLYNLLKFEVKS